jgi:putative transcriptional regulator
MSKRILENIHETAKDFYEAGLMNEKTMRKFDAHCLEPAKEMSKYDVKRIRAKTGTSQPVFCFIFKHISCSC